MPHFPKATVPKLYSMWYNIAGYKKKKEIKEKMGQYKEECALKALTKKLRPRHENPAGDRHVSDCVCKEPL